MRINKFVAAASGLSRRGADEAIARGRVLIAGRIAQLGDTLEADEPVSLDGQPLTLRAAMTIILNKPEGYVCTRRRQGTQRTVYDLLPSEFHDLRLAGRLDEASCGLVLLSNDGDLIQHLTHPRSGKMKRYSIVLDRPLTTDDVHHLEKGVKLGDGLSKPAVLSASGPSVVVSLGEGRNRQLRRTFGVLGYSVVRLERTHLGPYSLDDLAPGEWRQVEGAK